MKEYKIAADSTMASSSKRKFSDVQDSPADTKAKKIKVEMIEEDTAAGE